MTTTRARKIDWSTVLLWLGILGVGVGGLGVLALDQWEYRAYQELRHQEDCDD